jgi:hypothetical protein
VRGRLKSGGEITVSLQPNLIIVLLFPMVYNYGKYIKNTVKYLFLNKKVKQHMYEGWTKESICTRYGEDSDKYLGAVVPPIFQASIFSRKNGSHGYTYTRVNNPTTEIVEKKIAALEGGEEARCFSSGMAAITAAIMHCTSAGSHVIAPRNIYLSTRVFLQ